MRVVIALVNIVVQGSEHGAVLHIVTVDNGVCTGEVGAAFAVDEQCAACIVCAVKLVVQVIVVVLALNHDIVDDSVGRVYPCADILVRSKQIVEIDRDGADLLIRSAFIDLDRVGCGIFLRLLRDGDIGFAQLVIIISGFFVFLVDFDKIKTAAIRSINSNFMCR